MNAPRSKLRGAFIRLCRSEKLATKLVERIARCYLMRNPVVDGMAGSRVEYYLRRAQATTQAGRLPVGLSALDGNWSAIASRDGSGLSLVAPRLKGRAGYVCWMTSKRLRSTRARPISLCA